MSTMDLWPPVRSSLRVSLARAMRAIVVLQVLDAITTVAFLRAGGVEANPLMAPLLGRNIIPVMVGKVAVAGLLCCRWRRQPAVRAVPKAWCLVGFYVLTVMSNVMVVCQLVGR